MLLIAPGLARCSATEGEGWFVAKDFLRYLIAQSHISRNCPDRAAGPVLPDQLGAWGRGREAIEVTIMFTASAFQAPIQSVG